jgi:RNA polymerase sigma-70 factor (sigma-E family)
VVLEEEVVPAVGRDQDEATFEAFVDNRYRRLLQTAYLLTGDQGHAEDLLQASLAKTWAAWPRLHHAAADAYVRTVLVRTHATWWRRRWRGERPAARLPDQAAPDELARLPERDALLRALATLPPRMRAALVLRYFEDYSEQRVAEVLACPVGTVKSLCSRGLARLRGVPSLAPEQLVGRLP